MINHTAVQDLAEATSSIADPPAVTLRLPSCIRRVQLSPHFFHAGVCFSLDFRQSVSGPITLVSHRSYAPMRPMQERDLGWHSEPPEEGEQPPPTCHFFSTFFLNKLFKVRVGISMDSMRCIICPCSLSQELQGPLPH